MSFINGDQHPKKPRFALFNLGFRPFFLFSGLFSVIVAVLWFFVYSSQFNLSLETLNSYQWHAHEMIYGYSLAVIAGFVLTAAKNWTGMHTMSGMPLVVLFAFWIAARILFTSGMILLAGLFELLFLVLLNAAIIYPVVKTKQWKQFALIFKLVFFLIGNALFYLGFLGILENGIYLGIYGGLYLIVGLILMMGRKVVPFFIEKGVDQPVQLYNSKVIDLTSLALFLVFFVVELMQINPLIPAYSALLLGIVNVIRLIGWYTHGIWKKPLLWSIYLAMWFVSFGFFLFYLSYLIGISKFIAIHAFSYGGIGMITFGMMARVSLGHTARDIRNPPASVTVALLILLLGAIFRIVFCLLFAEYYSLWINIAIVCWVTAFLIFFCQYFLILTRQRIDGQFG